MGFKTWRLVSSRSRSVSRRSNASFTNESKTFLFFGIYAQGLPLLVCIATAIADACREEKKVGNGFKTSLYFPNMGAVRCFVGEHFGDGTTYFAGVLLKIWLKQGKEKGLLARILNFLEKAHRDKIRR